MQQVVPRGVVLVLVLVVAAIGCNDSPARVRLAPIRIAGSECGRPGDATELNVIAYASSGETIRTVPLDGSIEIADFPAETEQIGVELRQGAVQVSIGKSAPLAFGDLADGVTIPVMMAPPDGTCPVGNMVAARIAPLVARTGDGVLIVGGVDGTGPLSTAERYDPRTGEFFEVAIPDALIGNGFQGATLTSLPDGRAVLAGGPQPAIIVYDPASHAFETMPGFIEARAFHAAIAVGGTELLLAGGCSGVASGGCGGIPRLGSKHFEITDDNDVIVTVPGVNLRAGRIGASLFDIGIAADGKRTFAMLGGLPPRNNMPALDAGDRFALGDADAGVLLGSRMQAVALDGGAVLTAFADDLVPADGTATVFAPEATVARGIARAPDVRGVRLVALEDGRVLGAGGEPSADLLRYDPTQETWERFVPPGTDVLPALTAPTLFRLDDGSVLVLGGSAGGVASNRAWVFRPPLLGATSGSVTVVPAGIARANVLTPPDPGTVTRNGDWILASGGDPIARAFVGGPRARDATVRAVVRVRAGGVALLGRYGGPGQSIVGELTPGSPAQIVELEDGGRRTLCGGDSVEPFDPMIGATLELAISDGRVELRREDRVLAACTVASGARGSWGLAALDAGSEVAVVTVSVTR